LRWVRIAFVAWSVSMSPVSELTFPSSVLFMPFTATSARPLLCG
jgi:hypothetical protein